MTTTAKKIIEVFEVIVKIDEQTKLSFEDIILINHVTDISRAIKGKDVSLSLLDNGNTTGVIIGIIETTRAVNVPPKKNKTKKEITRLGLEPEEGLVYGNVFLYEKNRKILLYEVNRFGCYVDHFLQFLQDCCKYADDCDWSFSIDIDPILNPDEYKRMKKMAYYKSIELEFANPAEILKDHADENDALTSSLVLGKNLHSQKFSCKFEVDSKRSGGTGLANKTLQDVVDRVKKWMVTESGKNVQKLKVWGYAQDGENGDRMEPVDLLADRYIKQISLEEPRENSDLLQNQRKQKIRALYKECLPDFKVLFGDIK